MVTKQKNHKAFTLAEVLVTLGLIGIVAAMTIPALVQSYQKKQTATQLKKVYTNISQVVKQSEADNGPNQYWDWGDGTGTLTPRESFDTYWAPYLKVMKYCSTYSDCGYKVAQPWVHLNNGAVGMDAVFVGARTSVITPDGTLIVVFALAGGTPYHYVYVDINAGKGPNMFGKDVFMFILVKDKGFTPSGTGSDCVSGGTGTTCAAKMMKDGWQILDDYPW